MQAFSYASYAWTPTAVSDAACVEWTLAAGVSRPGNEMDKVPGRMPQDDVGAQRVRRNRRPRDGCGEGADSALAQWLRIERRRAECEPADEPPANPDELPAGDRPAA